MTDPASLPNFPPPSDEHPLRGRVLDVLIDLEFGPDIDSDGDIAFSVNDQQLFVRTTEGGPTIMRTFGQWQLPEELAEDVAKQLGTCNEVNLSMNLVKTGLANGTLVVTVDQVVLDGAPLRAMVEVSIQAVLSAVQFWHQRAMGVDPAEPGPDAGDGPVTS
ncbi:MAG: YbjN domain-containing protein [Nostocoides sp.]